LHILVLLTNWKSLKHYNIYLNPCDNGLELFEGVQNYMAYYNQKKHQTIKKNFQGRI
jgi:putative transposase